MPSCSKYAACLFIFLIGSVAEPKVLILMKFNALISSLYFHDLGDKSKNCLPRLRL